MQLMELDVPMVLALNMMDEVQGNGGAVHRCLHSIMHLVEDHAQCAGIPIRFAATKLVEGDEACEARA